MKINIAFSRIFIIFLTGAVFGCLGAAALLSIFPSIFLLTFSHQILIISSVWLCFSAIFYLLIHWLAGRHDGMNALLSTEINFQQLLVKTFLAVFFLFPIGLIASQHLKEFTRILTQGQTSNFLGQLLPKNGTRPFFIGVMVIGLFLVLALFILRRKPRTKKYLDNLADRYYILFIMLAGSIIRLIFIYLVNTQPVSDFANINSDAILLSQGAEPTQLHIATHVLVTMIYGLFYRVLGPQLIVIKLFHLGLYALSGLFIYYAGKEIFENKLWAGAAGALVVTWPSLAIYSNVLTPEHLFILVECALVFAVSRFFKNQASTENGNKQGVILELFWFVVIGFLLGVLGMFRPFSYLFLIAFLISLFIFKRSFHLGRTVLNISVLLLVFLLLDSVPVVLGNFYHAYIPSSRPCNLLVGLNITTLGQFNIEDVNLCHDIRSQIPDKSAFAKKMTEIALNRLRTEQNQLIPFVDKKFAILWTNSDGIIFWAINLVSDAKPYAILEMTQKINLVDFAMMFIATLACLAGTVMAFFKGIKPALFFYLLSFFGFNLMEIPFEIQTRYRTVVMPLFIFFACWAFSTLNSAIGKWENKAN